MLDHVSTKRGYQKVSMCPLYNEIIFQKDRSLETYPVVEQLGTYDPMPNMFGERLCSLNLERITYWIGRKAIVEPQVSMLLGELKSQCKQTL